MFKRFLLFLVIICLFLSGTLFGQQGFILNGNGARAAGMGYAFTGIADDATAISWNPAGLSQLQSMEASVIGRMSFGSGTINWPDNTVQAEYFSQILNHPELGRLHYESLFVQEIDSWEFEKESGFQLNFASFVFPLSLGNTNVVAGVGYRTMYDFSREITELRKGSAEEFETLTAIDYTPPVVVSDYTDYGEVEFEDFTSISGGIASISPSIGFQLNKMISFGSTFNVLMGSSDTEGHYKISSTAFGDTTYEFEKVTEDYSGLAIDLGVLLKPNEQFQIGANLNLPHTISWETDDDDGEVSVPLFFSIGAGFRATDNLTLAFDYRSRPWSNAEDEDGDEIFIEDANSIHVGMEYLANMGNNFLPIRIGFYTDPLPVQDANEDQISNNVFTAGIGIIMGNIILDSSFEWVMSEYTSSKVYQSNDEIMFDGNDYKLTFGAVIHFDK